MTKDVFEFVIYILHACANKWGELPVTVYNKLKNSNCISELLVPFYDVLHTQGTAFIVSDVEDFLKAREVVI